MPTRHPRVPVSSRPRSPSLTDRRVQRIDLTSAGRDAAAAARAMWERLESASTGGLTDRQRAELERLLTRSAEGLEAALADRGGTPGDAPTC